MIKKLILIGFFLAIPFNSFSANILVEPAVFHEQAIVREIFRSSVTITNNTDSVFLFYPLIVDVSEFAKQSEFLSQDLNRPDSLARWIEIDRRRMEILPGEEKTIPFTITVNYAAEPKSYYAKIFFSAGSTRQMAEENAKNYNQPSLLLVLDVKERIIERVQLKRFEKLGGVSFFSPTELAFEIENIGNRPITPTGNIFIYNSRTNREVGVIELNQENISIEPAEVVTIKESWDFEKKFGRYKAVLMAEYGTEIKRDIQDTAYFSIIPLLILTIFSLALFGLVVILVVIIKKMKS